MITISTNEEKGTLKPVTNQEDDSGIVSLPPKMQRFVQLYMTGQYTLNKLAQLLELHPNTLSNWLKRKEIKDIIIDMQQTTQDVVQIQLKNLTLKAVNKLSDLVDSPIDGVAMQAVKDILDRSGHRPMQEIKIDKTVRTYEQKLNEIISQTIDVEYEIKEVE